LRAELPPTGPLLPKGIKSVFSLSSDRGQHRRGIVSIADGLVVGERNMAHVEHVLQQGHRIHGEVAKGVLQRPAFGVLLKSWYEG
jgi:hypothetical protein